MKVTPNFNTRDLTIENRIKGVMSENLVDTIQFVFNDDFLGYQIIVAFVDDKKSPLGGTLLTESHLTGVLYDYPIPSGLTQNPSVFYQIVCTIVETGEVWKSNIDKIYFAESLDRVNEPISTYPLYPQWVAAIDSANEAAAEAVLQTETMVQLELDLELAESLRVSAEQVRVLAENSRVSAENSRAFWQSYDELVQYYVGNKVYYLGSSYICHTNSIGNLPTDTNYWSIIVEKGDKGDPGITSTVAVGTVTIVDSITDPTVVNSGTIHDAVFDFELARAPHASVGTTEPTEYSIDNPTVTNSGTDGDVIFDFVLPRAPQIGIGVVSATTYPNDLPDVYNESGLNGDIILDFKIPRSASVTVGSTTTSLPGTQASVINSGLNGNVILDFTVPRGDKGEPGNDFIILGTYDTIFDLEAAHSTGSAGDAWAVGTTQTKEIYIWNTISSSWTTIGTISPSTLAADIGVQDVADHFYSTNVETVLAEVQTNIDAKVETSLLSTSDVVNTVVVRDSNHDISLTGIKFTTNDIDNPASRKLVWDVENGTASFELYNGVNLQLGQEIHFYGRAQGAIPNGSVVCLVGSEGDNPIFRLSDASNPTFDVRNIIGLSTSAALDGEMVYITSFGRVNDVNTSLILTGTKLYFDVTTPGGLTTTPPVSPNPKVLIGIVLRSSTTGSILVKPYASDYLENLENVYVNSLLDGQVIAYNESNLRYENKSLAPSDIGAEPANSNIQSHISNTLNPHSVTAAQVNLGNVTNESKSTMFTDPTFTGDVVLPYTTTIGDVQPWEIMYLAGTMGSIQDQFDYKAPSDSPTFTGSVVLPDTTSIGDVDFLEISYLNGVTSSIQDQLDDKANLLSPDFSGTPTVSTNTVWHAGNDGSGSGLDADTIDGIHIPTIASNNSKILQVNSGGTAVEWGSSANLTAESLLTGFINYNGVTSTSGQFDGGSTAPSSTNRLNYNGYLYATKVFNSVYNDYAEYFEKSNGEFEAGDVIAADEETGKYRKSIGEFDNTVVGVFSDDFAHCIGGNGDGNDDQNFIPVGLAGRVKVKVIGSVKVGDLLVSSSIDGVAMSGDKSGCVIGKALESSSDVEVKKIKMLILNK